MTYLSNNLKYLRNQQNLSQATLANLLFVTHQTISNHETGKSQPDFKMIQKYADFYHVETHNLIYNDLSKGKKESLKIFDEVIFDKRDKTMIILNGTKGTYDYRQIKKCEILNEAAHHKGKEEPFKHIIVAGVEWMTQANILERSFYVGLKITMKDNSVLGIYTCNQPTRVQTDIHIKGYNEAKQIKAFIDKIVRKYKE